MSKRPCCSNCLPHQALNAWLLVTPRRQALGECGRLPTKPPQGQDGEGSLNMGWKESPFLCQGDHSNLGAAYLIESLGRQKGPPHHSDKEWSLGHSASSSLYPPHSPSLLVLRTPPPLQLQKYSSLLYYEEQCAQDFRPPTWTPQGFFIFKDSFWIMGVSDNGAPLPSLPSLWVPPTFEKGGGKWVDTLLHTHRLLH